MLFLLLQYQNGCCRSEDDINNAEAELSSSDSDSEPPDSPLERLRMYPVKPRPILQRRNTITGTTPTNKRPVTSIAEVRTNLLLKKMYIFKTVLFTLDVL